MVINKMLSILWHCIYVTMVFLDGQILYVYGQYPINNLCSEDASSNNLNIRQAVLSGNTEVAARNLHQHIQNLMQTDPGDNVTPMELEFKNLANVKAEPARYFFLGCLHLLMYVLGEMFLILS